jgi:hypothetical protein
MSPGGFYHVFLAGLAAPGECFFDGADAQTSYLNPMRLTLH